MYNQAIPVVAAADLSAKQYMAVGVDGAIAGTVVAAGGVLQDKPQSGEHGSIVYAGRTKIKAGGAIAVNNLIGVNSDGYFVAVGSGTLNCGRALEAVSSGGVAEAIVNFAGAGA